INATPTVKNDARDALTARGLCQHLSQLLRRFLVIPRRTAESLSAGGDRAHCAALGVVDDLGGHESVGSIQHHARTRVSCLDRMPDPLYAPLEAVLCLFNAIHLFLRGRSPYFLPALPALPALRRTCSSA